ncbi:hypothetical protein M404DRAFT_620063 [Pisolithus tinctorius Marx 270]|uniref:Uncharacterized protein n=1 Tax=Pisolithus tinctorius Marx 270 TaxID=870435 RepID=A0A0C3P760_PISTI|nr:hypothetical protein M404DRAFT_620063 [Pisolithus tinctorius Marx 270]
MTMLTRSTRTSMLVCCSRLLIQFVIHPFHAGEACKSRLVQPKLDNRLTSLPKTYYNVARI